MQITQIVGAALACSILGLAGCGSSGGGSNTGADTGADSGPAEQLLSQIRLNQYGYPVGGDKFATVVTGAAVPLSWNITTAGNGEVVLEGQTLVLGADKAAGEKLHRADLSGLTEAGSYVLNVEGAESRPLLVANELYGDLFVDSARFYYFHRMGVAIESPFLHNPLHGHQAIHPTDDALPCFDNWCGEGVTLDVKHTWYDAGDFGAYPVNVAISTWTLLNAYEFAALEFSDQQLTLPESGNGIPDLLDEVRFGSTFMGGMLPPGNQLASHKIHNQQWSGFEGNIDLENSMERYAQPPSTAATYAIARNAAHLARVFLEYDADYAQQQWLLANDAWQRAETNPVVYYTSATKDSAGGGDYDDTNILDDRYAAAAELWISSVAFDRAKTAGFAEQVRSAEDFLGFDENGAQQWQSVEGNGSLSLWLHRDQVGLSEAERQTLQANILATAKRAQIKLDASGYPMVYNPSELTPEQIWPWGSNSFVLNRLMLLGYAHRLTGDVAHLRNMYRGMDYLLGNNPLDLSFVTGYGEHYERDLHDRVAFPLLRDQGIEFPPGWVAGGPLTGWQGCDNATPETGAPAKRYGPAGTATEAWCSKEVAINWNSPLVWVTAYLAATPLN
ncbi:glycoside hydrolase family 9 protein [Neiella sp. HB171785]|uniref:Glycoside hydrolase family 9 protein n=1 Tax=Neiella litorisoli TaxID=2771431 RepID=A0A8J6R291_9GAMM|nr:glycoside hydrolase family 9 protein [Neiella litorisoli]MBD1388720.1 glycoside hydrolase family 9 protein [Neiella litorisoli]